MWCWLCWAVVDCVVGLGGWLFDLEVVVGDAGGAGCGCWLVELVVSCCGLWLFVLVRLVGGVVVVVGCGDVVVLVGS